VRETVNHCRQWIKVVNRKRIALLFIALACPTVLGAGRPLAKPGVAALATPAADTEPFSAALRGLLLRFLPATLYEASPNWGKMKRVVNGVKWTGKRINLKPELQYKEKNDGTWRKIRVAGDNLPQTLVLRVYNIRPVDAERFQFDLFLSVPVKVYFQQQMWESGLRLYDGTARARLRLNFWLTCEAGTRLDREDKLVPDLVVTLKVVKATFRWSEFHMEHAAGLGGDAAALIGDLVEKYITDWRPSLEREFIAKAEAAVLKAGQARELRLALGKWLGQH
jgi:hypothetical protein